MERLLLLQKRLGKQDLVRPGRELVREGEVELEELGQKEARHLVLLSDCLLCCSYKGHRGEERSKLTYDHKSIVPLNEVISVTGPGEEESTVFCVSSRFSDFTVETRYCRYCLLLDFLL